MKQPDPPQKHDARDLRCAAPTRHGKPCESTPTPITPKGCGNRCLYCGQVM